MAEEEGTAHIVAVGVLCLGITVSCVLPRIVRIGLLAPCTGRLQRYFRGSVFLAYATSLVALVLTSFALATPLLCQDSQSSPISAYTSWGAKASINFCEGPDFAKSAYVAEPVNTCSSFVCYSIPALFCLWIRCRPDMRMHCEMRFTLSYLSLAAIGLGSMALHATLSSIAQWADELPMIYCVTMLAYNSAIGLIDSCPGWDKSRHWILAIFPIMAVIVTVVYAFLNHIFAYLGFVFLAYIALLSYYGYSVLKNSSQSSSKEESAVEPLMVASLSFVMLSCFFWSGEMGLCRAAENGGLGSGGRALWRYGMHTGWHVTSALAGHAAVQALVANTTKHHGRFAIDWAIIPYVVLLGKGE